MEKNATFAVVGVLGEIVDPLEGFAASTIVEMAFEFSDNHPDPKPVPPGYEYIDLNFEKAFHP